jgi:hypothetical protein
VGSVGLQNFDVETLRERLSKMSDADLVRFGRAAASLCRPEEQFGRRPRAVFVEQLQKARAEWRRRHPKEVNQPGNPWWSDRVFLFDVRLRDCTSIESNVGFASLAVCEVPGALARGAEVLSKRLRKQP